MTLCCTGKKLPGCCSSAAREHAHCCKDDSVIVWHRQACCAFSHRTLCAAVLLARLFASDHDPPILCAQQGSNAVTYADEVYPRDSIAALANNDPDYPGSCGRCYEVRCHTGPIISNGTSVFRTDQGCAATGLAAVPRPHAAAPSCGSHLLGHKRFTAQVSSHFPGAATICVCALCEMVSSFAMLSVTLALAGTTCTRARPTPPMSSAAREPCCTRLAVHGCLELLHTTGVSGSRQLLYGASLVGHDSAPQFI